MEPSGGIVVFTIGEQEGGRDGRFVAQFADCRGLIVQKDHAVAALGALAQDIRLELINLLAQSGSEGLPAGVIAEQLGIAPASLSFHFQQLVRAGLLTQRRRSRFVIYTANRRAMAALLRYLMSQWHCDPARCDGEEDGTALARGGSTIS